MAATLMLQGKIDVALVGADRIAMNGDTANKIGTYNVAVLCHFHEIPFYVVAPYTTFDKECCSGNNIIIEQRAPDEVKGYINKMSWAPIKAKVYNPSFDVTPNKLITSFIFDIGVLEHHELIKLMAS
jgi:methylthioribose-1-phosphate isomerase